MNLETKFRELLRNGTLRRPPDALQGISKARITEVLQHLSRGSRDQVDAIFALLDDQNPSLFSGAAEIGLRFNAGASTAQIACHMGVLQRGAGKLDREGRDYWLKPLWEIAALEKVYFDPELSSFRLGHPVAKSPNSAYRVVDSFVAVLTASSAELPAKLAIWGADSEIQARLAAQAAAARATREAIGSPHDILIHAAMEHYAPRFLPGFQVLYIDAEDGMRIKDEYRSPLKEAGIEILLDDAMPDVLLWNPRTDWLWVIEAVTSDGEVDFHKVNRLRMLATRHGKAGIGFTTAYPDWKTAASRQGKHKNLPPGTHLWICEDGAKQFKVEG
ncbi:MAG: hypothetical protein KF833_02375 [Verrucomicrobiae bacterium]|nr:hypothetical protein [Verrucomicrobiae bacterium]